MRVRAKIRREPSATPTTNLVPPASMSANLPSMTSVIPVPFSRDRNRDIGPAPRQRPGRYRGGTFGANYAVAHVAGAQHVQHIAFCVDRIRRKAAFEARTQRDLRGAKRRQLSDGAAFGRDGAVASDICSDSTVTLASENASSGPEARISLMSCFAPSCST